jgi:hypothetical protein
LFNSPHARRAASRSSRDGLSYQVRIAARLQGSTRPPRELAAIRAARSLFDG